MIRDRLLTLNDENVRKEVITYTHDALSNLYIGIDENTEPNCYIVYKIYGHKQFYFNVNSENKLLIGDSVEFFIRYQRSEDSDMYELVNDIPILLTYNKSLNINTLRLKFIHNANINNDRAKFIYYGSGLHITVTKLDDNLYGIFADELDKV